MTPEEKQAQMNARNAEICQMYMSGATLAECASRFGVKRQRIKQIVEDAGIWRPYVRPPRSDRDEFLGVNLTEADKDALREEATRRGMSMSSLTATLIRDMLDEIRVKEAL